jgi:hypothetical protein
MSIPEPKVEHHEGRGVRSCPIFPELRPILDEALEILRSSQHGDGLEELEPTHRNDATLAPRRSIGVATIVPLCNALRGAGQQANGTSAQVSAARGLLLAWQLTTDRSAELSACD